MKAASIQEWTILKVKLEKINNFEALIYGDLKNLELKKYKNITFSNCSDKNWTNLKLSNELNCWK